MRNSIKKALASKEGPLKNSYIERATPVNGGCIHNAWKLELENGRQFFAKTTSLENFPMLEFEAKGLITLNKFANNKLIKIPSPLLLEKIENTSILVMPWLNLKQGEQIALGKGLAALHKASTEDNPKSFGWGSNGFIGSGEQIKGWRSCWSNCFTELRLLPQLRHGKKWGITASEITRTIAWASDCLANHLPEPSLVHGDLWSGNAAVLEDGKGVLLDPAAWWADREVDIAMTKLFGGFTSDFYNGYESIWPLPSDLSTRTKIYNFYHLLNHANIFGGSYINQCKSTLKGLQT